MQQRFQSALFSPCKQAAESRRLHGIAMAILGPVSAGLVLGGARRSASAAGTGVGVVATSAPSHEPSGAQTALTDFKPIRIPGLIRIYSAQRFRSQPGPGAAKDLQAITDMKLPKQLSIRHGQNVSQLYCSYIFNRFLTVQVQNTNLKLFYNPFPV